VGKITKFDIGRLEARNLELSIDCPNCGTARIILSSNNRDGVADITCPKCHVNIILDSLSLTVINENAP